MNKNKEGEEKKRAERQRGRRRRYIRECVFLKKENFLKQGQQPFSLRSRQQISGFVGHTVSVAAPQPCGGAAIGNPHRTGVAVFQYTSIYKRVTGPRAADS